MMSSAAVWPAMAAAFERTSGDLVDRLLAALDAAEAAGGDARGKQSAAMIVVKEKSTGKPWVDRTFDLRVDDAVLPLVELRRLVGLQRAYNFMNAGDLAMETGDTAGALAAYGQAQSLVPDSAEMVFWYGVALVNANMIEDGKAALKCACNKDSRWVAMKQRVIDAGLLVPINS